MGLIISLRACRAQPSVPPRSFRVCQLSGVTLDQMPRPFLTAEWRYLAMLNYAIDPSPLRNLVPRGVELDQFGGRTYVSLVGFRFLRTRVRGMWIPFHSDFNEVNLRFYVRRNHQGEVRRGVVFIREIVPRHAVAKVARVAFGENYIALPMHHLIVEDGGEAHVEYRWRAGGNWSSMYLKCSGAPQPAPEGSLEQFITEHYWGYAAQRNRSTVEYQVEHPRWQVWHAAAAGFSGDASALYGPSLAAELQRPPDSAFLADGSLVAVHAGVRLT